MPRDASGVYTLPAGNPVVDNTIIESTWANPTMSDIANQLNNVLTRDGLLGPTTPFKLVDGTVGIPSLTFATSPTLGFFRKTAVQMGVALAGLELGYWAADGYHGKITGDVTGLLFGDVYAPNGAVAAPSISFVNEPSTGLWRGAAGLLDTSILGVLKTRLSAGGLDVYSPDNGTGLGVRLAGETFDTVMSGYSEAAARIQYIVAHDGSDVWVGNNRSDAGALKLMTAGQARVRIDFDGTLNSLGTLVSVGVVWAPNYRATVAMPASGIGSAIPYYSSAPGANNARGGWGVSNDEMIFWSGGSVTNLPFVFSTNDNSVTLMTLQQSGMSVLVPLSVTGTVTIGGIVSVGTQINGRPAAGAPFEIVNRTGSSLDFYTNAAGTLALVMSSTAAAFTVPVTAPNIPAATTAWASAARALETIYTNATSKSLAVSINCLVPASGTLQLLVGGVVIQEWAAGAGALRVCLSSVVPAGATYQAHSVTAVSTLSSWFER